MSCAEYDAYLADPQHFQSAHQRAQHQQRVAASESAVAARAQERVEAVLAERRRRRGGAVRQDEGEEERAARERAERARAAEGQARFDEERAREAAERERVAEVIQRRRMEDLYSERLAAQITRACPGCRVRIEKDAGCMHMACEYSLFVGCVPWPPVWCVGIRYADSIGNRYLWA